MIITISKALCLWRQWDPKRERNEGFKIYKVNGKA